MIVYWIVRNIFYEKEKIDYEWFNGKRGKRGREIK